MPSPDQVQTPIYEQLFDDGQIRQFESLIPRGKKGRPGEIASPALFLAADESSYVKGMDVAFDRGDDGDLENTRPGAGMTLIAHPS